MNVDDFISPELHRSVCYVLPDVYLKVWSD